MAEALRLGFAGLGMAAGRLIPEIARLPYIRLSAAADLRQQPLAKFKQEFNAEVFTSVEAMVQSPNLDAVYVATPHEYHTRHALVALENRKHVIVEKPMALSIEAAEAMNKAAEKNGVKLMAGHTHSFDPPVKKIREMVAREDLGRLLMIGTSYYKDHLYRPFPDHDIEMSRGVVLNQGPHQVDVVRLIGGGMVRSVRAMAGVGDPHRPGEGHYVCYLEFENGVSASLVYSGYAFFDTGEIVWGIGEGGETKDPDRHPKARRFFREIGHGPDKNRLLEQRLEQWRYGATGQGAWAADTESGDHQPFFGLTIVTCERGDIRQSPDGLYIYDDEGRREVALKKGEGARSMEMKEFYDAIMEDRPVFHDGRWGEATLEVCLGILESASRREEVTMSHQVASPLE
ncbi:MAG TPA: Gfo/Idh/MocA family oxidoreductase [Candidatus Binatia bacterium]